MTIQEKQQKIVDFLAARPAINTKFINDAAGLPSTKLHKIRKGILYYALSEEEIKRLEDVLKDYGYKIA